jgi:maltose phosphorylase
MAGTWMAVVRGFAGMQVRDGVLHLAPELPDGWKGFGFKIHYRGRLVSVEAGESTCQVTRISGEPLEIVVSGELRSV